MLKHHLIAFTLVVGGCLNTVSAEPVASTFNTQDFSVKSSLEEKTLLDAGKLHSLGSLLSELKAHPDQDTITLPPLSETKLEPADVRDKLMASTVMLGLYYHCRDCHQMHFATGTGFVVGEGGVVTTCAHMLVLNSPKMLQAYPVAITAQGEVHAIDRVIAFDETADTVLVHVEGLDAPPLPLRTKVRVGESVYCLGHPGENPFIFTSGLVSRADARAVRNRTIHPLVVSCDYSPGSSGSPIADASGNVVAQADQILPQLLDVESDKAPSAHSATTTYATVYNLHSATGAVEIARLADQATRPPYTAQPPVADDDKPAAKPADATAKVVPASSPAAAQVVPAASPAVANVVPAPSPAAKSSPSPAKGKDVFSVTSQYDLFIAPTSVSLEGVKSFDDLFKLQASNDKIMRWSRDATARGATAPNYFPVGFTGVTGYFQTPGSTGPVSRDNTTTRGIEFNLTFPSRTESQVDLHVNANDNRYTPSAEDNIIQVDTKLSPGAFTFVKLGEPQKGAQLWLAVEADKFGGTDETEIQTITQGKLPADKKVDFKFTAADGQEVDTTKMRGKVILVDFWATWCGPCVAALPRIEELYDKYHKDGLEVLGINLDAERTVMDAFLKKHPHPWPQSISAAGGNNPLSDPFEIHGIPFFMLIDKTGSAMVIEARSPVADDLITERLKG